MGVARRARLFMAGFSQHVIQRGNNRGVVFRVPTDYQFFITILRKAAGQCLFGRQLVSAASTSTDMY